MFINLENVKNRNNIKGMGIVYERITLIRI
jgi:hypothetical protein